VFTELGVRTVLDLRTDAEVEERGRAAGAHDWHHLPLMRTTWSAELLAEQSVPERFLADRYLGMLDEGADAIGAGLRLLADPERLPAVFHCAAGKDRTGVMAALVLSLVGVPDDVVGADYCLSRDAMDRLVEYVRVTHPDRYDAMVDQPKVYLDCPEAAMTLFLHDLRAAHGSVAAYAESVGAGPEVVAALRANLLE
jgi:protein-tyrosine phosphatase